MQASDTSERYGNFVQQAVALANAEKDSPRKSRRALVITIGDVDLPAFVSNGVLYIQAPLPRIFHAFAEDISDFISDLEIRVSVARRASFPSARIRRTVSRPPVASTRLVQRSRVGR
jgi:hypothetical protein